MGASGNGHQAGGTFLSGVTPAACALSLGDAAFLPCKSDPFAAAMTWAAPGSRRWVLWGWPLSRHVPEWKALGVMPGQFSVKETGHQKEFSDHRLQRYKHLRCQVWSRKPFRCPLLPAPPAASPPARSRRSSHEETIPKYVPMCLALGSKLGAWN